MGQLERGSVVNEEDEGIIRSQKRARLDDHGQDGGQDAPVPVLRAIEDLQCRVRDLEKLLGKGPSGATSLSVSSGQVAGSSSTSPNTGRQPARWNEDAVTVKGDRTRFQANSLHRQFPEAKEILVKTSRADPEAMSLVRDVQSLSKRVFRHLFNTRYQSLNQPGKSLETIMYETLPPQDECDALVETYFEHCEKVYRVLHIPTFRKEYRQFLETGQNTTDGSPFLPLLTAVLAVASSIAPQIGRDRQHDPTYASASDRCDMIKTWLAILPRKKRLKLHTITIQTLLVLAEQARFAPSDVLWQFMGSVMRSAMTMGLHCDVSQSEKLSAIQKEVRKRLWLTLVELDLRLSIANGMPPLSQIDEDNLWRPLNINDDELLQETCVLPEPQPPQNRTDATLQLMHVETLPVRLQVAKYGLNGGQDTATIDRHLVSLDGVMSHFDYTCRQLGITSERVMTDGSLHTICFYTSPFSSSFYGSVRACSSLRWLLKTIKSLDDIDKHLFLAAFSADVFRAVAYTCELMKFEPGLHIRMPDLVGEVIPFLATTIGVFNGNIKDVLFLAAAVESVQQHEPNDAATRERLETIVRDARRMLQDYCLKLNINAEINATADVASDLETPESHLESLGMDSDLFGFLDFSDMDFDLDWLNGVPSQ